MYKNFLDDMATADKIEVAVIKRLQELYDDFKFNGFSGRKEYDVTFTKGGKVYTLEIKSDYFTQHTGNVVIEYECRGEPSGISTTKANFWAYAVMFDIDNFDLYIINTNKLRQLIDNKEYIDILNGGDPKSNTMLYRFKLATFEKNCVVIKNDRQN